MEEEERKPQYGPDCFRFCMDSREKDIAGRVYTPLSESVLQIGSIGELLLKMDRLFNENGYPQAFQEKRTFGVQRREHNTYRGIPPVKRNYADIVQERGRLKTVDIMVYSRRNTTWQGCIALWGTEKKARFKGELELMKTLHEWLDEA